jgi:hypothetical protein
MRLLHIKNNRIIITTYFIAMTKKIILLLLVSILFIPALTFAQYGLDDTAKGAGLNKYSSSVSELSGNIIGSVLSIIGVIFFILTVYAGALWMTARGQEEVIKKAQNTLIAAIIGLVITIGSYAITNFILQSADTGGGGSTNKKCSDITEQSECTSTVQPGASGGCTWDQNNSNNTAGTCSSPNNTGGQQI